METVRQHKSPIHLLIDKDPMQQTISRPIEEISPFVFPPWTESLPLIKNVGLEKSKAAKLVSNQVLIERGLGSIVVFTDGSQVAQGGMGAAAVSATPTVQNGVKLFDREWLSNYEAELVGFLLACEVFEEASIDKLCCTNKNKTKPWWYLDLLNPLIRGRNKACQWMLIKSHMPQ